MVQRFVGAVALVLLFSLSGHTQMQGDLLDTSIMSVKPEKWSEFIALGRKFADINRRHGGDNWLAAEAVYGKQYTVYLISVRANYAAIDKGYEVFYGAMNKALGAAGTAKMLQDAGNCLTGSRSVLRRRRWDLSSNPPSDNAAMMKRVGEARWIRMTTIHVRPGRTLEFEEQLKAVKEAAERANPDNATSVSQGVAGQDGTVFYVTWLAKSLGDFDSVPALPQLLGPGGFKTFQGHSAENVLTAETVIMRIMPETSNPPAAVAATAPDFWNPKPHPAPKKATGAQAGAEEKK